MEKKKSRSEALSHEAKPRFKSEGDTKQHASAADDPHRTPKKRRKVNHACVYCRRSHMTCDLVRPCTRCIKRNIAQLCRDEPRDGEPKKAKSTVGGSTADESGAQAQSDRARSSIDQTAATMGPPPSSFDGGMGCASTQASKPAYDASAMTRNSSLQPAQPSGVVGVQDNMFNNINQFAGFSDAWLTAQNHLHEIHNYPSNYMIAPEVTNEFNLLNEFLQSSLLEEDAMMPDEKNELLGPPPCDGLSSFLKPSLGSSSGGGGSGRDTLFPPSVMPPGPLSERDGDLGKVATPRLWTALPADKTKEYWLQAADPSGNDTPENRMQRVLKAKYEAGLLKPFNYVKGYSRLSQYLDGHVATGSKLKILRQLDRFRPKFREKMHALTDMDLVYVEMWFEKTLMEYDRVFASMAVPACCWRRTGEIFRGNQEMAELINVPVEKLRDGSIALHEILTEESVVQYWEEFGTIAFDPDHDTLLTACSLKNPAESSTDPIINCCFSFMIRRDDHKIPSLIVGNFLPHDPM